MKKIILLFSALIILFLSGKAQNITDIIMSMPDNMIIPLVADQKKILLNTENDSTKIVVENILGGDVERLGISSDYIQLKTSDVGNIQIKLLPLINDSYIIGVIHTVCDSTVCDSQISFYTTDWKSLQQQAAMFPAKNKDWFIKLGTDKNSQSFINAYAALDMTPVSLLFSPDNQSVNATYNIKGYLSKDDYNLIEPYLTEQPKIFNWDKSSFR